MNIGVIEGDVEDDEKVANTSGAEVWGCGELGQCKGCVEWVVAAGGE